MATAFATSRYNFHVPLRDAIALFNASTGAVLKLHGPDAAALAALLSGPAIAVSTDAFGDELAGRLRRNGFLVDLGTDEVASIRERYWTARGAAPIVLVVTTTMDCNLGCYYCYESRSSDALRAYDVNGLVAIARERLARTGRRNLHVDWYGGEPLLNLAFLESASLALQDLCKRAGVAYHASALSNGTEWPEDVGAFVKQHKLRQVQISFDGLKANHDRRRHFRRGHARAHDASSFELAASVVDRLLQHTRVDIRFNADPGNQDDLPGFLDFASARGWFDAPFRCVVMIARLGAYSDRAEFMRGRELSDEKFEALQALAQRMLPQEAQDDQDLVNGFPVPKDSVCGALALDSTVIGADRLEYRCGLQVGERYRAVGRVGGAPTTEDQFADRRWWEAFDPTVLPTCSQCSFVPVCWGGCPKRHLEGNRTEIEREGRFWRINLPRMIAAGFHEEPPHGFAFTRADQFRDNATLASGADSSVPQHAVSQPLRFLRSSSRPIVAKQP